MDKGKQHILDFPYGHPMGKGGYALAFVLVLISLMLFARNPAWVKVIGLGVLTGAAAVAFMNSGLLIDTEQKKYCLYSSGQKKKWKDISPYTDLCLLTKNYVQHMHTRSTQTTSQSFTSHEIYLMDAKHIRRLFLENMEPGSGVEKRMTELAAQLGVEIKVFNPVTRRKAK